MNKRKGSTFAAVLLIIAAVAVMTGCVQQFWPAQQTSPAVAQYVGDLPSSSPVTTLGNIKNQRDRAKAQHIITALDLRAALDKDDALYSLITDELSIRIQEAQTQYDRTIGTPEAPGILGSILFASLAGLGVNFYNKKTMYTEAEVQALGKAT